MDTTCIGLGQRSAPAAAGAGPGQVGKLPQDVGSTRLANAAAATNTSASADSPVWSSGSGALKVMIKYIVYLCHSIFSPLTASTY